MERRANRVTKDDNVDSFFLFNRGKRLSKVCKNEKSLHFNELCSNFFVHFQVFIYVNVRKKCIMD